MDAIRENLQRIRDRIRNACGRADRDPGSVRLIAVSKTVAPERIRQAAAVGLNVFGENYVQEALGKMDSLGDLNLEWHFIGHLQTNKVRQAVPHFHWIQTVDRVKLAREIDRRAEALGKSMPVLLQVHLGGEETKAGVDPEDLPDLFEEVSRMSCLEVRGLMTLPPYLEDPEEVRPYFRQLRRLLEVLRDRASEPERLTELSMGMSHDFEVAIEEGATMVRVGTALFGPRLS
ncbi:hypothetical protein SAMN02745206_02059 [Desulfacinum infernum DSM 9756]|jgi:hypothetical protein|uniref:Pyridoxal phosphate homeostasis protein n=1 Tax=Desulfacinum infernum DSM 9756 TaxID=1121391 RepID=A0A1M5BYE2_9BACT|nr:YggS family pyridoxal phosphate-dependent enzyme [Desulfacinum infernum]SHF47252.1 hypothetical protein SAMN02745206_02059 [Desulfacinum infernum DSM 9756]